MCHTNLMQEENYFLFGTLIRFYPSRLCASCWLFLLAPKRERVLVIYLTWPLFAVALERSTSFLATAQSTATINNVDIKPARPFFNLVVSPVQSSLADTINPKYTRITVSHCEDE